MRASSIGADDNTGERGNETKAHAGKAARKEARRARGRDDAVESASYKAEEAGMMARPRACSWHLPLAPLGWFKADRNRHHYVTGARGRQPVWRVGTERERNGIGTGCS